MRMREYTSASEDVGTGCVMVAPSSPRRCVRLAARTAATGADADAPRTLPGPLTALPACRAAHELRHNGRAGAARRGPTTGRADGPSRPPAAPGGALARCGARHPLPTCSLRRALTPRAPSTHVRALAPRYDGCMQACTCVRTWYRAATQRAGPPPRGAEARLPANLTLGGYFMRGIPQDVVADTFAYYYLTGRGFYFEGASKWFVTGSACGSRRISWQPPRASAQAQALPSGTRAPHGAPQLPAGNGVGV